MIKKLRNKRGFTLLDLMIIIAIIGFILILITAKYKKYQKEQVEQKKNIISSGTVVPNNNSDIQCIDGSVAIIQNGKVYYLGTRDSWGDLQEVPCNK